MKYLTTITRPSSIEAISDLFDHARLHHKWSLAEMALAASVWVADEDFERASILFNDLPL